MQSLQRLWPCLYPSQTCFLFWTILLSCQNNSSNMRACRCGIRPLFALEPPEFIEFKNFYETLKIRENLEAQRETFL